MNTEVTNYDKLINIILTRLELDQYWSGLKNRGGVLWNSSSLPVF